MTIAAPSPPIADQTATLRALLRYRMPQSKAELFEYCKEHMRIPCEVCKGAKEYWAQGHRVPCGKCKGQGAHGFHLGRVAICPDHVAPLDVLWELLNAPPPRTALLIASREGGKTRMLALYEHLSGRFHRKTITHMGAISPQFRKVREYLEQQTGGDPEAAAFGYDARTKTPAPPDLPDFLRELTKQAAERMEWANGAAIDFVPGTLAQASGPHYEVSVLDEVDELQDPLVQQKFAQTASGERSVYVMASTYSYATGPVAMVLREQPRTPTRTWCLFEALSRCEYPCDAAPLPDGTTGRCPFYDEEVTDEQGRRVRVPLCGGEKARRSDGHIPLPEAIAKFERVGPYMAGVELFCRRPQLGLGAGLAYWAFSAYNKLPHDPPIRPDVPLELSVDFNPGVDSAMCWLVLQQAPLDRGELEFWVVDEIVLPTSSTPACVEEVIRRYGPHGSMLPADGPDVSRGHQGGLWVYGDATGHSRNSAGTTDYRMIVDGLRGFPDFRLLVLSGEANPPLADRLNRANELLYDPISGRRTVKIAPRCVRTLDELSRMPLKLGTREKDKGPKIQRLGLSHLGDDLEYWGWKRFPGGLRGGAVAPTLGGSRTAAAVVGVGGQRAVADWPGGADKFPSPWARGGR